jgi:hypothetical protein
VTLRDQARQPHLFAPAAHTRKRTFSFHALTAYRPHNSHRSIFRQIRQDDMTSPVLSSLPKDSLPGACYSLTPLQSSLTENSCVTPLESALPKTRHLKSFRIRTYEKGGGEGCKLLTRLATTTLTNPGPPNPVPCPPAHCGTGHTVPQSAHGRKQFRPSRCLSH